jgi:hypothetical protein
MNESARNDDALDALLHASAPEPLVDDGFVARTMVAVDQATRSLPVVRRATPVAPLAIARALVVERRRHAEQARLWRWAIAGVVAGFFLMLVTVAVSPGRASIEIPDPSQWVPLAVLMAVGALSIAWRELRDN